MLFLLKQQQRDVYISQPAAEQASFSPSSTLSHALL